jgi:hypothetical protein
MESAQNVYLSAVEEYQFFLRHKHFNHPDDIKYVETEFNKNWNFKPYYMTGFDGKTNGFIDNPHTMNLTARKVLGLPGLTPRFKMD